MTAVRINTVVGCRQVRCENLRLTNFHDDTSALSLSLLVKVLLDLR